MGKAIMAAVDMIADASLEEYERFKEFGYRSTDVAKRADYRVRDLTTWLEGRASAESFSIRSAQNKEGLMK
jgi:hypothetical protein